MGLGSPKKPILDTADLQVAGPTHHAAERPEEKTPRFVVG